jgi:radical SAM modification target selenobiotic family peptide
LKRFNQFPHQTQETFREWLSPSVRHERKAAYKGLSSEGEEPSRLLKERRRMMDEKQMKKFLAGLCLTGLLTGAGLAPANAQQSGQSG